MLGKSHHQVVFKTHYLLQLIGMIGWRFQGPKTAPKLFANWKKREPTSSFFKPRAHHFWLVLDFLLGGGYPFSKVISCVFAGVLSWEITISQGLGFIGDFFRNEFATLEERRIRMRIHRKRTLQRLSFHLCPGPELVKVGKVENRMKQVVLIGYFSLV